MDKPDDADMYDWELFCQYAQNNGISLNHPDDYQPWRDCWKAGYCVGLHYQ